jgi:hypothetical protein
VLVQKYAENVEVVDPQLKNNAELAEVLNHWEKAWTLAREHITDPSKCAQLATFSRDLEDACSKN